MECYFEFENFATFRYCIIDQSEEGFQEVPSGSLYYYYTTIFFLDYKQMINTVIWHTACDHDTVNKCRWKFFNYKYV